MDPHRISEARSIELHARVAARLGSDPTVVERAVEKVRKWQRDASVHPAYASAWLALLSLPTEELGRALVVPDERMRALRQVTPFTFVVPPRERWAIWREVKERVLREEASA